MSKERFVKLFCFLLLLFTFSFTHTKAEGKDFELSNAFKDVENHSAISTDVCNSTKDCNFLGQCINIAGENICDCYYNGLSGKNCEIIDECVQNSGMCGADGDADCSFHMMKKKAYCKCKEEEGQRFDEPTKKCVPQKKCTNYKECHNGAVCEEKEGDEKYCSCEYGTSGDFCDIIQECVDNPNLCGDAVCRYNTRLRRAFCYCDDINQRFDWSSKSCVNRTECNNNEECSTIHGACADRCQPWEQCNYTDTEDKRSCHCVEGTSGQNCEVIDDCFNKIVDCGTGDNVVCKYFYNIGVGGHAYCECTKSGQKFDEISKSCKDCDCGTKSKECRFKKGIRRCRCESDAINFGDRCEDCKCGEGSKGCNYKDGVKECFCNPGYNVLNGICENCNCGKGSKGCVFKNGVKECFCNPGYNELNGICEKCDCGSHSKDCKFKDGKKVCTCEPGFKAGNYSICTPMCDDKHACANGARCLQDICVCLTGTGGPYCETIYECENKLCGDDVTCQYDSRTQRAYCQCKAAQQTYDSDDKSCKKCSCGDDLKTEWERCDFVLGKKVCQCTEGYAYSPKADKCLECDCGNNSKTCTFEDKGEKVCQCFKGYIDNFGTCKKCECGSNGECSFDSNGNFSKCLCDSGFSENSGKCVLCDCGPKSKCSFQNKRKMCLCAKGYKDDEGYCTDIDECLNTEACPGPGTLCENTFGSYKCRCQQGYQGRSPTETDKKSLCEKIVESGPNYTPWKIGYGLLSVGFIIIIACLAYVIFRMHKNLKISNSSIPLRNRNPL